MRRPVVSLFVMVCLGTASADQLPDKNPFNKPDFMSVVQEAPSRLAASDVPRDPLSLKATLLGQGRGLANIDGVVLAPGDEYQGFRLLAVNEGGVVLERDGERVVLQLFEESDDE